MAYNPHGFEVKRSFPEYDAVQLLGRYAEGSVSFAEDDPPANHFAG